MFPTISVWGTKWTYSQIFYPSIYYVLVRNSIPGYTFIHRPSSTKAGGVGAYVFNILKFAENDYLRVNINVCEDLWLNTEISGEKSKFTFAVVYRHPCDNTSVFI